MAIREWNNISRMNHFIRGALKSRPVTDLSVSLNGSYYITTDKGLFFIEDSKLFKILDGAFYGIAFSDEYYYLSAYFGKLSTVVRGRLDDLKACCSSNAMEPVYTTQVASTNSRIHQVFFANGTLYIADSGRNTIVEYDEHSGRLTQETAPFLDQFGYPIYYDNNHINSVAAYNDYLIFTAYRAGSGSMIGVVKDGKVVGFRYPNIGVHDVFVTDQNFFFCDSFGVGAPDQGGALICSHGPFSEVFSQSPGWIVRGIAGDPQGELLVGHSHKGDRRKRFRGNGALLLFQDCKFRQELTMPYWSQTYQIIQADGQFVNCSEKMRSMTYDSLLQKLTHFLNDSLYEENVHVSYK